MRVDEQYPNRSGFLDRQPGCRVSTDPGGHLRISGAVPAPRRATAWTFPAWPDAFRRRCRACQTSPAQRVSQLQKDYQAGRYQPDAQQISHCHGGGVERDGGVVSTCASEHSRSCWQRAVACEQRPRPVDAPAAPAIWTRASALAGGARLSGMAARRPARSRAGRSGIAGAADRAGPRNPPGRGLLEQAARFGRRWLERSAGQHPKTTPPPAVPRRLPARGRISFLG